jgi:LysM repeat protein
MRIDSSGEYTLHASCKRMDGSFQASGISLNRYLENDHGSFRWVGGQKKVEVAAPRQITVQSGDTLRGIARQVGCGFEEIARVNGIQNPDLIYPGQVLNIPGGAAQACGGGGGGGPGNFGLSARNVRLVDGGRRLEAELLRDGQWVGSSIVLDERIGNENGTLTFKS